MTKAINDRILKDANGDVSSHLQNHIHLTNCIHLKNHVHKHSPMLLGNKALMRDLVVLRRSKSLRDPSASPPSWRSPSLVEAILQRAERNDDLVRGRRHSVGIELHDERKMMSENSNRINGAHDSRRIKREESSRRVKDGDNGTCHVSGKDGCVKTAPDVQVESDDDVAVYFNNRRDESQAHTGKNTKELGENTRSHEINMNRGKRRKFRGARRKKPSLATDAEKNQNDISVASNNSHAQGMASRKYYNLGDRSHEYDDSYMNGSPKNGCGIPLNWSRIHDRGKSFLDKAGRSLSCGLSEPRRRDISDMRVMSGQSSSSTNSNGEELPLVFDSDSRGFTDRSAWIHDYSGELAAFADNLLKRETRFDLVSESRSSERHGFRRCDDDNIRHQNITQKYMPRTFRDLIGQNLVVQALSNAVSKGKAGFLYVFYGPHGTGKTACARIFARALNCQSQEPPKPCGFCDSCIAHDRGKTHNVREIGQITNLDLEGMMRLVVSSKHRSLYKVLIFDQCDSLSPNSWSTLLKVIDRAPRHVIFVLVCSSLNVLPHMVMSRCQKFFFPKLKDTDIIHTLQCISTKEGLEIDRDALKLIASRSDGSLRDAEMTLEQLGLLGQKISLPLVQELVGLISDEKLVDLLDLALSADTVNTVKNLRYIMEAGVEPLALVSQLATVITDILAGSYDIMKERPRRKFFRRQALMKEDMEKLRQALKTLSEAEKQVRVSHDGMTWLTAALLQLAPEQQCMPPVPSDNSPQVLNDPAMNERPRKSNGEMPTLNDGNFENVYRNDKFHGSNGNGKGHVGVYRSQTNKVQSPEIEEIWSEVIEKIPVDGIREFMYHEAKLVSITYGAAPTVQLMFKSLLTKAKAETFRFHILQAFESVLRSPVTIEIRCELRKDFGAKPILLPELSQAPTRSYSNRAFPVPMTGHSDVRRRLQKIDPSSSGVKSSEIVELEASPRDHYNSGERNQSLSLIKSRISLAQVIQEAEGCPQHSGWSKRKAVSIAEKLEKDNLRREPRSRKLLCWNAPKLTRQKFSRLKVRTRRPRMLLKFVRMLLKFVSCGRCLSARSPR